MIETEMIDLLALRVEDPEKKAFSVETMYKALNLAQMTIINLIDNQMLTELETSEELTMASGVKALSNLNATPIRNGIYQVYNDTSGSYCNLIQFKDIKRLENTYLSASATNPVAYVFKNELNVIPRDNNTVQVYFLKKPDDIGSGVDCSLDESLHEAVVDLAEGQLWKMDGQYSRAESAQSNGMSILTALNERLSAERPQGIGTYGRVTTSAGSGTTGGM